MHSMTAPPLALAGGSLIFLIFLVVMFFVFSFTFYSRRGSAINQHPRGAGRPEDPGVGKGPSRISAAEDDTEGKINSRGTG